MRNVKMWLAALFVGAALASAWELIQAPSVEAREEPKGDYWRNHDGHWSLWHEADKRWYYTDGTHWFYHDGKAWEPYRFDKKFGHDFVRGEYKIPDEKAKIERPRHAVFRR